jgi:putative phosphoribosyl transferase
LVQVRAPRQPCDWPQPFPNASLSRIHTPTLLIVGSLDTPVIEMNEAAYRDLNGIKEIRIVPGATHLFEEPGTLEQVARLAAAWFNQYL